MKSSWVCWSIFFFFPQSNLMPTMMPSDGQKSYIKTEISPPLFFFFFYDVQSKEGIFWMSWQDFQVHFRSIYVCRLYPPEMCYSVHGQWRGYSAGGCQDYNSWHQNPQYRLKVTGPDASSPVHVFITLTQVSPSP